VTRRWDATDRRTLLLVLALTVAGSPATAQREIPNAVVSRGTLSFDGHATAGDFTGTTDSVSGELTGGVSLSAVRGWVEAPVRTLVTGNGRRDKDLNKSLESDRHPTMRFDLSETRPEWERGDSARVVLVGTLTIHGVTLPRELPATIHFDGHRMLVKTEFPLNLKDHRIGGLSKFLGVLKMHPDIEVRVDLEFAPGEAEPPSG
jgi:polyisoprenoid-binding protein YceI